MREALLNKAANFSGRMVGYSADLYSPGFKGILASGANFSEDYKKRRNISHRAMTMYVEGKGNVEEIIGKQKHNQVSLETPECALYKL